MWRKIFKNKNFLMIHSNDDLEYNACDGEHQTDDGAENHTGGDTRLVESNVSPTSINFSEYRILRALLLLLLLLCLDLS